LCVGSISPPPDSHHHSSAPSELTHSKSGWLLMMVLGLCEHHGALEKKQGKCVSEVSLRSLLCGLPTHFSIHGEMTTAGWAAVSPWNGETESAGFHTQVHPYIYNHDRLRDNDI
jgi:hypothetical protein